MKRLFFVLLAVALMGSCKHEPEFIADNNTNNNGNGNGNNTNPPDTTNEPDPSDTLVCFETEILPLLNSNCAMSGCHNANNPAEGIMLDSYQHIMNSPENDLVVAGNPWNSEMLDVITEYDPDKIMPPPPATPLTQAQINLIVQWMNQGAQNTTGCSGCDTSSFTFAANVLPLIQTNCNGCHSGSFPSAGINLTTYAGIAAQANNGKLVGTIYHLTGYSAMPKNQPQMSACERTVIRKWVQAGANNN